jgi:hypothetical protein
MGAAFAGRRRAAACPWNRLRPRQHAGLGMMRDARAARLLRVVVPATVFPLACHGLRTAARDSILFSSMQTRDVVGTTGFRAQAALQRREFGTNRKRQAKTGVCGGNPHHGRVLFVQHPPENALAQGVPRGSVVACARSFGNCVRATEGGIPKSSRAEVMSLTSLAFSGCVRRRDET